ncbi:MAG: universal stress protein [Actinomycetota bacterium]|nr:universal stress protein [Actinomycetota bacterium]MDQ3789346.1 universal stress protein [Actinomycetota bacterium]
MTAALGGLDVLAFNGGIGDTSEPSGTTGRDQVEGQLTSTRQGEPDGIALVVAGYDGSDEAATAVRWAAQIALQNSGSLRVVWVWQIRDVWDEAIAARDNIEVPSMTELEDIARRRFTEIVHRLVAETVPDVDIHMDRGPDEAGPLLHASSDADLLVIGSRGRGRVATALLGSVSARCIREATCPVLVIPHQMVVPPAESIDPRTVPAEIMARRSAPRG